MPFVSIIIPVYNTEKYVERCLDSVCGQTLSDIEIICINDGSTDNSLQILHKYAEKDNRIKVIDFKKNKGVSAARNAGIDLVMGEYIAFIDSDDYVDVDFYEKLYNKAKETEADIVKGNRRVFEVSKEVKIETLQKIIHENNDNKFYFSYQWTTAIYKKDLIIGNNIRLPEETHNTEDIVFLVKALIKAKKVIFIDDAFYNYVRREISLNSAPMDFETKKAYLKSIDIILNILNNACENELNREDYVLLYAKYLSSALSSLIKANDDKMRTMIAECTVSFFYNCLYQAEIEKKLTQFNVLIPHLKSGDMQKTLTAARDFSTMNQKEFMFANLRANLKRS